MVLLFTVSENETAAFSAEAAAALEILASRPGFLGSRLGRAADDPASWVLVLEWVGVGAYRRALSGYEAKVATAALMARASQSPSAFEVLRTDGPRGVTTATSDRAADPAAGG